MPIESMTPSNHFNLFCPLLLLPSIFPSSKDFSNEFALFMKWSNYLSFSFNIYLSNEYFQGWFPLGLTGLTSLQSKGLSRVFSSTTVQIINSLALSCLYGSTLICLLTSNSHILRIETDTCWHGLISRGQGQLVKNLPAMWETRVPSLGWEDPLEEGTATHSSILAWRIPRTVYSRGHKELNTTERLSLTHFWALVLFSLP